MLNEIYKDAEDRMQKSLEHLRQEFATLRTGRASPALLEGVKVDYYGTSTPLNQIASITAPEPRLLIVQPWDKNAVKAIEKAIQSSDLGLNPATDGHILRVPIPELTEERRRELVKYVHKLAEDARVAIRNVRRDANDHIKRLEKEHEISEDNSRRGLDNIQDLTDKYIKKIDEMVKTKEEEILTI